MLLEFSQYLENYLWKYYEIGKATKAYIVSIATMINEKFRERVYAWECFSADKSDHFADLFHQVLLLCLNKFSREQATYQELSILIKFLDNCVNSLEVDLVRNQVRKICNLAMWHSLSDNRRESELKKFPELKKPWKALAKMDQKMSETERERATFERHFLKGVLTRFLKVLYSLNRQYKKKDDQEENLNNMQIGEQVEENMEIEFDQDDKEKGEIDDDTDTELVKFKLNFLNRCLELIIDLEALLPTRRFFNTLLEDSNLLIHCQLCSLIKETDQDDKK